MELQLSAEQEAFRDVNRKFLDAQCSPALVRALAKTAAGFEPNYWRKGAEVGWTSLLVSETDGGGCISNRGLVDLTVVASEFGRHAAAGPLIPTNLLAAAVSRLGTAEQKSSFLSGILAGDIVAAACLLEPRREESLDDSGVIAEPTRGGYRLSGVKSPVEAAAEAQVFLVAAKTATGVAVFSVPAGTHGLLVEPLNSLDLTRRFGAVNFNGVEVPISAMLDEPPGARHAADWLTDLASTLQVAEIVGALDRAFEITVEWAKNRYSFGRTLASYQAIKHRFADMKMWLEASHAIASSVARAVNDRTDEATELASAAKSYVGQYGPELVQECIQMHGGIGVTYDHDLHLYLRRVAVSVPIYGSPADHRERLTTMLQAREAVKT